MYTGKLIPSSYMAYPVPCMSTPTPTSTLLVIFMQRSKHIMAKGLLIFFIRE